MTDIKELEEYKKLIEESGLFDSKFYVREYKDARRAKELPLEHFVKFGLKEDRKPNALFDPVWYREYYGDIKEAGVLPFVHYVLSGKNEGRYSNETSLPQTEKNILETDTSVEEKSPINGFNEKAYLEANPDVKEIIKKENILSVKKYLKQFGLTDIQEGKCKFHKSFDPYDETLYLTLCTDVEEAVKRKVFSSGFEHFCLYGYKEIIEFNRDWNNTLSNSLDTIFIEKNEIDIIGQISEFSNGNIRGWIYSKEKVYPLLTINGHPCNIIKTSVSMPRVAANNKLNREDIGFIAKPTTNLSDSDQNNIVLYGITENSCKVVVSTDKIKVNNVAPRSLEMYKKLKYISSQKDAVVIVVWEATHNPIGRAKVLYDILKEKRPVIMVGFDFGFGKNEIWDPLKASELNLLTIHWDEKELFKQIIDDMKISFDTVWICKPRLSGYVLADMLSHDKTKFILDIDDNEKAMSTSEASKLLPYGIMSNYISELITKKIISKSVASISIKNKWGGEFVRHARKSSDNKNIRARNFPPEKIKIGFIGTVRPHKNLQGAAKAIKEFNETNDIQVSLTVGGRFIPESLRDTINSYGAVTLGMIPNNMLDSTLETFDVILTGFPSLVEEDEITYYQISSKIGDGLSMGRPVLVPYGSSVSDLGSIDGIYLFDENNFAEKLKEAIAYKDSIKLNKIFTFEENYKEFLKLEKTAKKQQKNNIFSFPIYSHNKNKKSIIPTLVLMWKQPDSSLYGRRIDQIARSYKRSFPNHRVIILEIVGDEHFKNHLSKKNIFAGDDSLIIERIKAKEEKLLIEGIEHKILHYNNKSNLSSIRDIFLQNRILPVNSIFILFPMINHLNHILNILDGYKTIIDIVDNQLGWKSKHPEKIVEQYKTLTSIGSMTIFNSKNNQDFFYQNGLLEKDQKSMLIPNWYELPVIEKSYTQNEEEVKIFYSGNMNDRIDWELIENLLDRIPFQTKLYLIGNAQRSSEQIINLMNSYSNCIYLGPLDERTLVQFISTCHLAIMPHKVESTSMYMNPIKIHMYASVGIECVSTKIPGLENSFSNLIVAGDDKIFLDICLEKIKLIISSKKQELIPVDLKDFYKNSRDKYLTVIEKEFKYLNKEK